MPPASPTRSTRRGRPDRRRRWKARGWLALATALLVLPVQAKLPREVGRAFLEAGIPLNHVGIVVQETTKARPLFEHDSTRPRNPASVMKLVTTFAALDLLGPDYRWKTEAYLDGPLVDGELHGDLILKGHGDPKITIEQWQSFIAQLRANGLAAVDGDLALDRSHFALPPHDPGAFDHEPLKPYNVGPDALLVNFKSLRLTLAPDPGGTRVVVHAEPPLGAVTLGPAPAVTTDECADWRLRAAPSIEDRGDRGAISFGGTYPFACGERDWWVSMLDHPHYVRAMFETYFREAGGRFAGGVKERRAPAGGVLCSAPSPTRPRRRRFSPMPRSSWDRSPLAARARSRPSPITASSSGAR